MHTLYNSRAVARVCITLPLQTKAENLLISWEIRSKHEGGKEEGDGIWAARGGGKQIKDL